MLEVVSYLADDFQLLSCLFEVNFVLFFRVECMIEVMHSGLELALSESDLLDMSVG